MAKNASGESRIPVPRAVRPSFLPKSRLVGSSKSGAIHGGHRRSTILSGCLSFIEHDDTSPTTTRGKFTSALFASSPLTEGKLSDSPLTIPPIWSVKENELQDSPFLQRAEDKIFSVHEASQMNIIEDAGDIFPIESSLGPFNDSSTPASSTPHYLMLNQKQNSFEHDESLGILTPDQMTDFTVGTLGCSRTPSCENLTGGSGGSRLALTRASASRPSEVEAATSPDAGEPTEGSSERTPSPEELPLDPKPVEVSTRPVPSSFVTSVTSITSLEAGYQGDGENSRPASRGPDLPAVLPMPSNLPAPCRQDPMTDSDFFTESDADVHEEIVRGDRRAQVIDGTLFCAPGGRRCPSFTGEEMDSSGIYSDLDKRQDERNADQVMSEDRTPDTADTEVSQRSQPSPIKPEVIMNLLQIPKNNLDTTTDSNCSTGAVEITVIEVNNEVARPKSANKPDPAPLKKYKMPKRNVVSKIKAMIESGSKEEPEKEPRRAVRTPRKSGRWDAVMSKIEAGKNEQRSRPLRKEVKSRLLQSLGPSSSSSSSATTASARRLPGDANNNKNSNLNNKDKRLPRNASKSIKILSKTEQKYSPLDTFIYKPTKRTRTRQGPKSPTQETARSSVRSSMSDLSSAPSKDAPKRSPTTGSQPRRVANGRTTGHQQQQTRINNCDAKKGGCPDVSPLNLDKSPTPIRTSASARRNGPVNSINAKVTNAGATTTTAKDRTAKENNINANNAPRNLLVTETRDQAAQTDNIYEAVWEKRAVDTVQALSITVQYLAHELEGFSAPKLRKDCERMKNEWMMARTEVEDLQTNQVNLEERIIEEREDHQRALEHLRAELEASHAERIVLLESALEEEKANFAVRLEEALDSLKKEHEASIMQLVSEHEAKIERMETEAEEERASSVSDEREERDENLREQVRFLKSVLKSRMQENAILDAEVNDLRSRMTEKEALRQRVETLEAQIRESLSMSNKEHRSEMARLRAEYEADLERKEAETDRRSFVHDQGAALRAEVWSLRSVLELRSQENAVLRTEIDGLRRQVEGKEALEQRVESLEARCEDLKAQLDGKESYERQISHENEILLGSFHEVSKHNKRLSQRNEELQWRLRQKNEVVNVLANQLATPPQRLSRSLGPEHIDDSLLPNSLDQTLNGTEPSSSSMVKFMVQKGDSVSWTLEIDESSDSLTSGPPPSATVSRQNSLRAASRKSVDFRARSKSVSISSSSRDQLWSPGYNSTPASSRRRPRSDPSATANDVVVAAAVKAEASPGPRPQEAGGEAMISEEASATSSEDESSTSSDIPRLAMDFPWSKDAE